MRIEFVISTANDGLSQGCRLAESAVRMGADALVIHQLFPAGRLPPDDRDEAVKRAESLGVRVLEFQEKGLARSRNRGLENAHGDFLVPTDDDVRILPDAVKRIVEAFAQNPDADLIAFQACVPGGEPYKTYRPERFWHSIYTIGSISSIEIVARRSSLLKAGVAWNEEFGLGSRYNGCLENAFLARAVKAGLKILYLPIPIVEHPPESSGMKCDYPAAVRRGAVFAETYGLLGLPIAVYSWIKHRKSYARQGNSFIALYLMVREWFRYLRSAKIAAAVVLLPMLLGLGVAMQWSNEARFSEKEYLWISISSNLARFERERQVNSDGYHRRIEALGLQLLRSSSVFTPAGWLQQPGIWSDHEEYRYAGHASVRAGCEDASRRTDPACALPPKPVPGIGRDVSHFSAKWPIFLAILRRNAPRGESKFVDSLRTGMADQLFSKVIDRKNSEYRFRNYMDGTNGLYRWNYDRRGFGYAVNPWGSSQVPYYSSLALLGDARLSEMYTHLASKGVARGDAYDLPWMNLFLNLSIGDGCIAARTLESDAGFATFHQDVLAKDTAQCGTAAYQAVVGQEYLIFDRAFGCGIRTWKQAFAASFNRFEDSTPACWSSTSHYHQSHYLLLLSEYLVRGEPSPELANKIYHRLDKFIRNLDRGKFDGTLSTLIEANRRVKRKKLLNLLP